MMSMKRRSFRRLEQHDNIKNKRGGEFEIEQIPGFKKTWKQQLKVKKHKNRETIKVGQIESDEDS